MSPSSNEYIFGKPGEDPATGIDRATSVNHLISPLQQWLDNPDITEICMNRPNEVWCESHSKWVCYHIACSYQQARSLATAIAAYSATNISDTQPILSAILPNGERVQVIFPPACEHGTVSITIRKPSFVVRSIQDYEQQGFFAHVQDSHSTSDLTADELELLQLKEARNYIGFLQRAVQLEKVIIVAGETGSGKTTLMKTLVQSIPRHHRIITIEDVPELFLPDHPNHVHLFYPSESKEEDNALVTSASLLRCCLRMKPTRILLAELRGAETFDFVNACASGHGGSITSCHAGSAELTFERLALMMLQNRQGRTLPYPIIRRLLHMVIDIVVHVHNDIYGDKGRHITEVWYDPKAKRRQDLSV